jgi:phosphotriesterase-related protein
VERESKAPDAPVGDCSSGPIDTADLGFTLMHEHILVAAWSMREAFHDWVDLDTVVDEAVQEVRRAKQRGVQTIVDVTPINLGRDIHVIREVAARAEMQIVVATGLYLFEEPWLRGWEVDRLVEFLLRDIESGIQGTHSKAGIIKAATGDPGVTPINRKGLQVAARLHFATGLPITTHTSSEHRTGPAQQDVFEEEGVDLGHVVIGHCGDTDDVEYLEGILQRGSLIGMDRFGLDMILSTEKRIGTIAELCRRGWADRMVLSHDHSCYIDWWPKEWVRAAAPRWSLCHVPDDIVPALRQAGARDEHIKAMTVANPARVFGG